MKLTDAKVRNAKRRNKDYKLTDGHGLHLFMKTNGAKLWRWRYEFEGKEKLMSFGAYPDVTITAAREDARNLLDRGIDPMAAKKELVLEEAARHMAANFRPFRDLAWEWFE
jgi:hypothetical protein